MLHIILRAYFGIYRLKTSERLKILDMYKKSLLTLRALVIAIYIHT